MVELTDPEWECPRCPDGFIIPGRGCDSCGMSLVEVGSLTKDLPRASAEYRLVVSTENPSRPSPSSCTPPSEVEGRTGRLTEDEPVGPTLLNTLVPVRRPGNREVPRVRISVTPMHESPANTGLSRFISRSALGQNRADGNTNQTTASRYTA